MTGPSAPVPGAPPALPGFWDRLKEHKIAQWTLAYAAAAYTLLHAPLPQPPPSDRLR